MADIVDAIIKVKRGTEAQRKLVTFADGELAYSTDTKRLFVGDGSYGGNPTSSKTYFGSATPTYAISGDFFVDTALTRLYVLTGNEYDELSAYGLVADGGAITSMYTTICANSAGWGLTGASYDSFTVLSQNSAYWQDTYATVSVLSSSWSAGGGGGSVDPNQFDINQLVYASSANWSSVYTSVNESSANWNQINSTYATVNTLSTSWSNILSSANVQTFVDPLTATGKFLVFDLNGTTQAIRLWDV
jgi:hypothetical protein